MSIWRKIRIIGMTIFFIEGLLTPFFAQEVPFEDMPLIFNFILILMPLLFFPLGLVIVMSMQSINPFQNKQWTLPDWDSNFFNLKNPLQFFHTAAFFIGSSSVGMILASFFSGSSYFVMGLAGISGSAGVLLGVKLCIKVYKNKFQSISEPVQQRMNLRAFKWSKICGTILILCALVVFIIAGLFLKNSIAFKKRAIETTGIVKSIESKQSSEGTRYYPVFQFTDNTGKEHIIRSSVGSNPSLYKMQDKIQILYDPESPKETKISSFWYLYAVPVVLGVSGIINLITGLVFLFVVPVIQKILVPLAK